MSEHRVTILGSALRRAEDPENSRDPRVRRLVEALNTVDYAPAPSPRFREELRAQLVAVAPRIIAESTPTTETAPRRGRSATAPVGTGHQARSHAQVHRRFVRPIAVAAGVAAAFLMLFGGAVWLSQKSLPGDSLYGLKRASENVQLALSSGGTDRGHEYLSLAQTRVQEAQALLRRDSASASGTGTLSGGLSPHTAQLIADNLSSADFDLRHGSDLLNTQAVKTGSQSPLSVITMWAPGQLGRLQQLASALPQGSLQNRTKSSWTLTRTALTRARTLAPAVATGCASTANTDSLGPVPTCTGTPSAPPTGTPKTTTPTTTPRPGSGTGSGGSTIPGTRTHTPARPATSGSARAPGTTTKPPGLLPSKAPVSVGSCGISVSLGPIGVGVGGCPSHS